MALRSILRAKAETVYGTDAAGAAANIMWAENLQHQILGSTTESDPARPGRAPIARPKPYGQAAQITFEVPLAIGGSAGTAPKWGALVKACGASETIVATTSVTYAPLVDPNTGDSLTIDYFFERRRHKLTGARGRVGVKATAGQRPMLVFTFIGLYSAVAVGAAPVQVDATWTGWQDAENVAQGRTTLTFNAVAQVMREFSLDPIDNVIFKDLPGRENVILAGKRGMTGSMKVDTPLPSALNFETLWEAATVVTAALVHGTGAGNIITVNARVQIDQPAYGEEDGVDVSTVPLRGVVSALNADDDWSIAIA